MNDTYLLRRIQYTPCYVKIYCDIPIKFLQEVYFNSIIYLPKAIFDKNEFTNYEIVDDYIKIDIGEWFSFMNDLLHLYDDHGISRVRNRIITKLNEFSNIVDNEFKKKKMTSQEFEKLIYYMSLVDSYAIFNMFIPIEKYNKELINKNIKHSIEDVMICSFEPHRIQLRKAKLNMAIKYAKQTITLEDYQNYFEKYMFFEEFEKWVFDTYKYANKEYVERELKRTVKKYTVLDLEKELNNINISRQNCINKALGFIENVPKKDIRKYSFLSTIVTEEEKRHMIECKLLLLIGMSFSNIDIDIGRSSIKELSYAIGGDNNE